MKKIGIIYLILITFSVLSILPLSGCVKKREVTGKPMSKTVVRGFKTKYYIIPDYLKSPGNTVSLNNVVISAHITGYAVFENARQGQAVSKGQLLLKLSAPEINSRFFAAKAAYINAKKTYGRIKKLYKENSVSRQTYDNTLMQYRVAGANLNRAEDYLNYEDIYSPINGIITKKIVSAGDLAAPGQPLLTIQGITRLEFKTSVNIKYLNKIKDGEIVELYFSSINKTLKGKVISVVRSANRYSHSVLVRILVPGAEKSGLIPGMYGTAKFKIGTRKAIKIPAKAIVRQLGITGVYTANGSGEIMFQPVKKGSLYKKDFRIILNGLNPDMTVIIPDRRNLNEVKSGSYVRPEFAGH